MLTQLAEWTRLGAQVGLGVRPRGSLEPGEVAGCSGDDLLLQSEGAVELSYLHCASASVVTAVHPSHLCGVLVAASTED